MCEMSRQQRHGLSDLTHALPALLSRPPGPLRNVWVNIFLGEQERVAENFDKAIEYFNRAKEINLRVKDRDAEAKILECLSLSYRDQDKYEEAISFAKEAIKAYSELGENGLLGKGHTQVILGMVFLRLGWFEQAIQCIEKGIDILLNVREEIKEFFIGSAYGDLAFCYNEVGDHENAINFGKKALEIAIKRRNKEEEARSLHNIGDAYSRMGFGEKAIKYCEKSAAIFGQINMKDPLAASYGVLANSYNSLGQTRNAVDYYKKCIKIKKDLQQYTDMAIASGNLGNFYYRITLDRLTLLNFGKPINECFENSIKYLKKAIEKISDILSRMSVDSNKTAFVERFYHWHVKLTWPFVRTGRIEAALLVLDLGKAKALKSLLDKRVDTSLRQDISWSSIDEGKEKERIRCIANEIQLPQSNATVLFYSFDHGDRLTIWTVDIDGNVFSELWKPGSDLPSRSALEHCISSLLEAVSVELPREYSFYTSPSIDEGKKEGKCKNTPQVELKLGSGLSSVTSLSGQQSTQNVVQSQETTSISKDGYSTTTTSSTSSKSTRAGVDINVVQREASSGSKKDRLLKLYHALIGPVKGKIRGNKLIIVPHGDLFFAPFSAITDESGHFLSEKYQIQIIPSMHTLASSMKVAESRIGGSLFVGNPSVGRIIFRGEACSLLPLPSAAEEASRLASLFGAKALTDAAATKQRVLKLMSGASIIHIAAHGEDKFGYIFLAPNSVSSANLPAEKSYLLLQKEVLQCKLFARLVVLSCCHTGRGQTTSEGVLGIARSFLGAGARAVLMTLWKIHDQFTKKFMEEFYSRIREGISACEALKETTNLFHESDTYGAFPFWAAFEILGEDVRFTREEIEKIRKKNEEM